MTFQGRSVEELKQSFRDSVDDYLAYCEERGDTPDRPFSGRLLLRLSPDLHRNLYVAARKAGKSLNAWIVEHLSPDAA